jgi:acyl-coenzyme A thioesterase PaaI-like protein
MPPEVGAPPLAAGQLAHFRALESLYRHAAINRLFESEIEIAEPGFTRIRFDIGPATNHAAGAAHGTLYFKMMDDAAFYACNSMVSDRFLLTTAFNLVFTRPLKEGPAIAEGRWVSGKRRVFVGEARLVLPDGEEAARGTGTFMRSHIPLSSLEGYWPA